MSLTKPKSHDKTTRSKTDYFLIGQPASSISGGKLPTTRQVLKFYLYAAQKSGNTNDAVRQTVDNVLSFWNMARITTRRRDKCVEKLKQLVTEWKNLRKSKGKAAAETVTMFKQRLDLLWDVGAADAIEEIKKSRLLSSADKEEDIKFYLDQRGARCGSMSGNDKVFAAKKRLQEEREEREAKKRACASTSTSDRDVEIDEEEPEDADDEASSEEGSAASPLDQAGTDQKYVNIRLPRQILNAPAVKQAADRFLLSNNKVCTFCLLFLHSVCFLNIR